MKHQMMSVVRPMSRALCAAILALSAFTANADMKPCKATGDEGLKLLVDDLLSSGGDETVMRTLISKLDAGIQQLELEAGSKSGAKNANGSSVRVRSKRCPGRQPITSSDFDEGTVRELNNRRVVIELWGTISLVPGTTRKEQSAIVSYALIPIHQSASEDQAPGVIEIARVIKDPNRVDDLLAVLDQSGRLPAYTAAATGVRLISERNNWDGARTQLCIAQARLEALGAGASADDQLLLKYVKKLAGEVVGQARKDPAYNGSLKLLNNTACGLGT